jgi:catechol 2,3-dioxygenase-like lactoylglutathione lyase family enzyme
MSMNHICPVLITRDIRRTVEYYRNTLGFLYADHTDKQEKFIAVYRDSIEIIFVEGNKGTVESNYRRHGAGEDVYICPDSIEGVDLIYKEFDSKGVTIISKPTLKEYGSYEFQIEDIDGRIIGIGLIKEKEKFFSKSNLLSK